MEIEYTANLARYGESLAEYNRRAYVMESSETENMKHVLRDCKDAYEADLHISFLKALDTEEAREFIERFEELKEKFKANRRPNNRRPNKTYPPRTKPEL